MLLDYASLYNTPLQPTFAESIEPFSQNDFAVTVIINEKRYFFVADKLTTLYAKEHGFVFVQGLDTKKEQAIDSFSEALLLADQQLATAPPMAVCIPFEKIDSSTKRFAYDSNGDVTIAFLTTGHNTLSLLSLFLMSLAERRSDIEHLYNPKKPPAKQAIKRLILLTLKWHTQNMLKFEDNNIHEHFKALNTNRTLKRRMLRVFTQIAPNLLVSSLNKCSDGMPRISSDITDIVNHLSKTDNQIIDDDINPFALLYDLLKQVKRTYKDDYQSIIYKAFHNTNLNGQLIYHRNNKKMILSALRYVNYAISNVPHLHDELTFEYAPIFRPSAIRQSMINYPHNQTKLTRHYKKLLSALPLYVDSKYEVEDLIGLWENNIVSKEQIISSFCYSRDTLPVLVDFLFDVYPHEQVIDKVAQLRTKSPITLEDKLYSITAIKALKKGYFSTIKDHLLPRFASLQPNTLLMHYGAPSKVKRLVVEAALSLTPIDAIKEALYLRYQYEAICILNAYKTNPMTLLEFDMEDKLKTWCLSQFRQI